MRAFASLATGIGLVAGLYATPTAATDLVVVVPPGAGPGVQALAESIQSVLSEANDNTVRVIADGGPVLSAGELQIVLMTSDQLAGAPNFNVDDLDPVALLTGEFQVMVVSGQSRFTSLADVVFEMQNDPLSVQWVADPESSASVRGAVAEIMQRAGADIERLRFAEPRAGRDAVRSLATNSVTLAPLSAVIGEVSDNRVRALAITSSGREDGLEIPTFDEQGLGADTYSWTAVMVPSGMPQHDRERVADLIEDMVHTDAWRETLEERGWFDYYAPADSLGTFFNDQQRSIDRSLSLYDSTSE